MIVQDVMSKEVVTCNPSDYVSEVADQMRALDIGCIPIVSKQKIIGIVTDRDIVTRAVAKDVKCKVEDIMTKNVISISPLDTTMAAAALMAKHQIRRLPVTDEGRLVGFLSIGDLAFPFPHVQEVSSAMKSISEPNNT